MLRKWSIMQGNPVSADESRRSPRRRDHGPRSGLAAAGEGTLGGLLRNARRLARLQARVRGALQEELAGHVHVVGLAAGHLRLLVSSSMRATELRYQQRRILGALADQDRADQDRAGNPPVRRIDISVRPDASSTAPSGRSRRPLGISATAARQLEQAADEESDPELRRALERLASRRR
jgi:hypothetical protein